MAQATSPSSSSSSSENFDDDLFETRLEALKDTQDGIQQMSTWCLEQRAHYKKIIQCWLNVFKRVRVEHRLVLFYLANDVIQYSKRKKYEFVECWATALQRATTMVRDDRVKGKILRIFNIWEQREIYNEEFLSDLSGLLNISPPKKSQTTDASDDFHPPTLIAHIRECVQLAELTDKSFDKLPKLPNCDIDVLKNKLKDKSHSCDIEKEFERSVTYTEAYKKHLQNEIKSRRNVIKDLDMAMKFYATQRGEVKVVATAYKNFASRVKMVNKKVDDLVQTLASPMPSPDVNAPSPEREADLQLPGEQSPISMNMFQGGLNGYSSFLDGGKLPFDINDFKPESSSSSSQPIEVIGSRSDEENYNTTTGFFKPDPLSSYSSNNSNSIPGLSPVPASGLQSEYSSLQSSAPQYTALLPPPTPPVYAGGLNHNINNEYVPHLPSYSGESYSPISNNAPPPGIMQPPPPLPPALGTQAANSSDEFNSTWDLNMSWTPHDSSNASSSSYTQSTPHSPPHFDRKPHNNSNAPIEYSEHHADLIGSQDVDHRQIKLPPAFNFGAKLNLSKDKSRQLADIDHRNLISLTGSPGGGEKDFHTNTTGDVDYRIPHNQGSKSEDSKGQNFSPSHLMAPPSGSHSKKSPLKSNASSSSESAKEDGSASRYDPTDMVVDMDMSDEDLDDILKDIDDIDGLHHEGDLTSLDDSNGTSTMRPALLETPGEYIPHNVWDANNTSLPPTYVPGTGTSGNGNLDMDGQAQSSHPSWSQMTGPWNGNCLPAPPPPRPPFGMQFQQQYPPIVGSAENVRSRGRGRAWGSNQFRPPFQRMSRGGGVAGDNGNNFNGARPYFNRGSGVGVVRGHRGKFRGNNSWI